MKIKKTWLKWKTYRCARYGRTHPLSKLRIFGAYNTIVCIRRLVSQTSDEKNEKTPTQLFKSPNPYPSRADFGNSCRQKMFKDRPPNGDESPDSATLRTAMFFYETRAPFRVLRSRVHSSPTSVVFARVVRSTRLRSTEEIGSGLPRPSWNIASRVSWDFAQRLRPPARGVPAVHGTETNGGDLYRHAAVRLNTRVHARATVIYVLS